MNIRIESITRHFNQLSKECSTLAERLNSSAISNRRKFAAWIEKRKKLEAVENEYNQSQNQWSYQDRAWLSARYTEPLVKFICNEILKLLSPRKRKYALSLLKASEVSSEVLSWEVINSVPSAHPLATGNEEQCATCTQKIDWRKFFSKCSDQEGNNFCSKKCKQEFWVIACDRCQDKIKKTENFYYVDEIRQEGVLCFPCASIKCEECKRMFIPAKTSFPNYLLPHELKVPTSQKSPALASLCELCRLKKNEE